MITVRNSFLRDYLKYCENLECPQIFSLYAALGALGSLNGRRVWIDRGYFKIYPNLYVMLLGEPGGGKTTAMNVARNLLKTLKSIRLSPKSCSVLKLIELTKGNAQTYSDPVSKAKLTHYPIACFLSEFSNFIGIGQSDMINFLNDGYDDDFTYNTKAAGEIAIDTPAISMVACAQPAWITSQLKSNIIGEGFARRVLWAASYEENERKDDPEPTPELTRAFLALAERIHLVHALCGPFKWTLEAETFYKNWYRTYTISSADQNTISYWRTKRVQVQKIAMLLAMSERVELELRIEDVQEALDILTLMEATLSRVFAGIGRNALNEPAVFIQEVLKSRGNGGMSETVLRRMMFKSVSGKEFDEILLHLTTTGIVHRSKPGGVPIVRVIGEGAGGKNGQNGHEMEMVDEL